MHCPKIAAISLALRFSLFGTASTFQALVSCGFTVNALIFRSTCSKFLHFKGLSCVSYTSKRFRLLIFPNFSVKPFKMVNATESDPLAIPRRILKKYQIVQAQIAANPESWRKLSFEAHKKLCNVLRRNSIDYPEFEFWFSRFARGNFDLDYDRRYANRIYIQYSKFINFSADPKARSLTDLPWDTFEKVGEYLDFDDK